MNLSATSPLSTDAERAPTQDQPPENEPVGFDALIEKVRQAEDALEAKERQTGADWRQTKSSWRAMWTPGRIVVAGLVSGYIVGRAEPFKRAAGGGTLQLISALGTLFAGDKAKQAADQAHAGARGCRARGSRRRNARVHHTHAERRAALRSARILPRQRPPVSASPPTPPSQGDAPTPTPAAPTAPDAAGKAQAVPVVAPVSPDGQGLPRASLSLRILAALAVAFTLWATQELILPILLALFFALVGNPIIRLLQKLWVPRAVSALLLVAAGLASVGLLGRELMEPAGEWIQQVPKEMRQIGPRLQKVVKPVQDANKAAENIARAADGGGREVQVVRTELNDPYKSLTATPKLLASVLAVVLLTLFFMIFGQRLQHAAIALLPSRHQKRLTVEILQAIELEMSRYVLTISVINVVVGLIFAAALHWVVGISMQEALLWGTVAAVLNFAPYVGPLIGVLLMLLMGFVKFDYPLPSMLPAAIYLGLHTIEGQIITPLVLGRRMAISPLMLILALMVFGWTWGIIGLLLAVPLLVCVKIVLSKIDGMEGWAKLLE